MARAKRAEPEDPTRLLEAFVLRARRVLQHSLIREHLPLMQKLYKEEMEFGFRKDSESGETKQFLRQVFPPEELMESFAGRLRPLILESERIHYTKVFDAIEALVPSELLAHLQRPIPEWRKHWADVVDRAPSAEAQAYLLVTKDGAITDRHLMYEWLYGDLVHADDVTKSSMGLSIDERYRAAASVISRIGSRVNDTYELVKWLVSEGVLQLSDEAFSRPVVVSTEVMELEVKAYQGDENSPLPKDLSALDPNHWTPAEDLFPQGASQGTSEATQEL